MTDVPSAQALAPTLISLTFSATGVEVVIRRSKEADCPFASGTSSAAESTQADGSQPGRVGRATLLPPCSQNTLALSPFITPSWVKKIGSSVTCR